MKGLEMTDTTSTLSGQLRQQAVCNTDHPANAVTALMSAAVSILVQQFGEDEAGALMLSMVGEARAEWMKLHAN